jgi:hypothetical protein
MLLGHALQTHEAMSEDVNSWFYVFVSKRKWKVRVKAVSREDAAMTVLDKIGVRLVAERRVVDKVTKKRQRRERKRAMSESKAPQVNEREDGAPQVEDPIAVPEREAPKMAQVEVSAGAMRAARQVSDRPEHEALSVAQVIETVSGLGELRGAVKEFLDYKAEYEVTPTWWYWRRLQEALRTVEGEE